MKICGSLGPSNNLLVPNPKKSRGLYYYGNNYYIFYKVFKDKKFSFQFTFIYNNIETVRFIFKYPLSQMKAIRTNTSNIEIPINIDENKSNIWTIYKFNPVEFIVNNLLKNKDFSSFEGITNDNFILKSFEAFSTIYLRGVYVSNFDFILDNLPKEMSVRTVNNRPICQLLFIGIEDGKQIKKNEKDKNVLKDKKIIKAYDLDNNTKSQDYPSIKKSVNKENTKNNNFKDINDYTENNMENIKSQDQNINFNINSYYVNNSTSYNNANNNFTEAQHELKEMESDLLNKNTNNTNKEFIETKKETLRNLYKKEEQKKTRLLPDPIMSLNFIIGYSAKTCSNVIYNSHGDYNTNPNAYKDNEVNPSKKHIYFCAGSNLIKYDPINIKQKFFLGHSKPITCFITACKGEIIFSNQAGVNSIIRVWKTSNCTCYKMLTTPFDKLKIMTENKTSKLLCTVGNELNKESIIIWNIENLDNITAYIRQTVQTSINIIKFSPFEEKILVSCGRENIKFWRIKNDHLNVKAVVLNQFSKNNDFLCLDFNNTMFGDDFTDKGKVYIGSTNGCIFQIACNNQELEAVYKVQNSSILSIAVNEAFCATGSQDGYLRIWPVDFSEFLIEAKHDTGVCSVDISYDALEILCGTLGGSIGILNVQNKEYKTILRSPPNIIKNIIIHPSFNYLFTIEGDNSVRIWDIEHKAEAYQFVSTKDPPICVAAPNDLFFICGFSSGIIKVFDLEKTEVLYECKPFKSPVNHLLFIQQDKLLIAMSAQGNLSIHDCLNNYKQSKIISIDTPAIYTDISIDVEKDYFCTIGSESNCALVWNCITFGMKNRVIVNNFFIKKICLINKNLLACILDNCSVRFYSLSAYEGIFIKELLNLHINNVNQFITTNNYKFLLTSGEEGMIKIWDMKMVFKQIQSYQQFIGHSTGVRGLIMMDNKGIVISTSENSGIYFWNFLGDTTFTENEIIQEFEKLNAPNNLKIFNEKNPLNSSQGAKSINIRSFNKNETIKKKPLLTKDIRVNHMDKVYKYENEEDDNTLNPNYENITKGINKNENNQNEQLNELKVLSLLEENGDEIIISYDNTDFNVNQEILNKYDTSKIPPDSSENQIIMNKILFHAKNLPNKLDKFNIPEITSNKIKNKFCLGLSINSMNNIVFNKINKWYAYTVNNKIIIEFLENERKQKIIEDSQDELSCLIMSKDGKFLLSTVGCANIEEYAPIFVYETFGFTLKKKLNFHFKGIQHISISPNGKYMVSIGTLEEKSICTWNFTNLTVIDSKSVKYNPFYVICDQKEDLNLNFITAAQFVLSFWKINENYKLEGYHINFGDLAKKRIPGEYITALAISPYFNQIKTSYVLLGTNKGNLIIIDKESKAIFRTYCLRNFALTKIFFEGEHFVCAGEAPIVFCWKFNENKVNSNNVFSFLETEKKTLLYLDSAVNSLTLSENGEEGLLTTNIGSIFFLNFEGGNALKIISSHFDCKINSLDCDTNNQNLFSSGKDGGIRCWLIDSFDQRFLLQKINQTPNKILLNQKENILVIQFEMKYLSLYNIATLKSLGKIKLPNEEILDYDFIFNNNAIIIISQEKHIYLINFNNWEPASVQFSELIIAKDAFPKNQLCKSVYCQNIGDTKSYSTFSFSDGTVTTFLVKKIENKINIILLDKYNMIDIYMEKNDDKNIQEMKKDLTNFRNNYITSARFSNHLVEVIISFHECLQFLFIRNFVKKEIIKLIPLNYFPFSLALSDSEKYISIGTKEGLVLFITKGGDNYNCSFNLEVFKGHYDTVDFVKFSHDNKKLFSSCQNELFVWEINQ